jgi:hypothetical protein
MNEDNSSCRQKQQKPCCGVKVDTAAKKKKDLGMFYLRNASINPLDIFPKDIPEKLCTDFSCKGKECNNASFFFAHPRKASNKTIVTIASHFIKKDVGWFNKHHFMRIPNITDGVKKLLGNTKGPTSRGGIHKKISALEKIAKKVPRVFFQNWCSGTYTKVRSGCRRSPPLPPSPPLLANVVNSLLVGN